MPGEVESYVLRFEGGPLAELPQVFLPKTMFGWPLPDRLGVLAHLHAAEKVAFWDADDPAEAKLPDVITESPNAVVYRKANESQVPQDVPGVVRGATYQLEAKVPA